VQEPTPIDPPEQELEEALAALALSPTGIGAETLWYQAGLARERRRASRWRAAAAVAIVAAGAAVFWRTKPASTTVDHVVVVREQEKAPAVAPEPRVPVAGFDADAGRPQVVSAGYLRLRDRLLRDGPASLPAVAAGEGEPATALRAGSPTESAIGPDLTPGRNHFWMRGG
jgi:hypothetical protein